MQDELKFAWAEPSEFDEIQTFVSASFGAGSFQAQADRIHWLYGQNPLGIHIATCRHEQQLVAICPHIAQAVQIGNRPVTAAFGIDFIVQPQWRRLGIGQKFLEMRLARFVLSLSTGQSPAMHALYLRQGAIDLGPFQIGYYRKHPLLKGKPRQLMRGLLAWAKGLRLLQVKKPMDRQRLDNTNEHLDSWHYWRFGPSSPYGAPLFAINDAHKRMGLVCSRQDKGVEKILSIVPVKPDRPLILSNICRTTLADEVQIMFCGDKLKEDCQKAGFLLRAQANRLIAMSRDTDLLVHLIPGSIDLMAESADIDLMRPVQPE